MGKWISMKTEPYVREELNIREFAMLNGFDEWAIRIPNANLKKTLMTGEQKVTGIFHESLPDADYVRLLRNSKTGAVCMISQPYNAATLIRWAERKKLIVTSILRDNGRYLVAVSYGKPVVICGGDMDESESE